MLGKTGRVAVAESALEIHLQEQLGFLKRSCVAFDGGVASEYKRMALAIRVLCYDRGNSKSLLMQLGMKGGDFLSYCEKISPSNLLASHPLVMIELGMIARYLPVLDDGPVSPRSLSFDQWWSEAVFRSPQGITLSRGDFVLIVANQDGGAHVDPAIDKRYNKLANENLAGWVAADSRGESPMLHMEKMHLRHIAFECIEYVERSWQARQGNKICTCGSGRKYRYCCGRTPK